MDLYLAAAYNNEEGAKMVGEAKIRTWLEGTRETRRAFEEALLALNQHRTEHGC
jgi:hypothetical protein